MSMLRIGLISDTHGSLPEQVYQVFEGVDYIIHAGDIGSRSLIWELESIAPTYAVLGNNDWQDYGPSVNAILTVCIGEVRIAATHHPWDAERLACSGEYDLVIHGHTHVPCEGTLGTCRVVNPGSCSRPRKGSGHSVATIAVGKGTVGLMRIVAL